ncbi:hypothetical protein NE865_12580 [Phthorimaea operculella]|nr:hypothetical protein NE865_12580 [Phthorimaea operculella]
MALPQSLPRLTRLARVALSPRARAASDVPHAPAPAPASRDSCNPTPAPPCPPCVPHPRPPCRARPAERVKALRVTCCPPPRGMRPPCAPPLPACALDCTQAKPPKARNMTATYMLDKSCDEGADRVAARLAASREWRRKEYMREVRERRPPPPPCNAPYRLPAERECARAIDGKTYTIADSPPEQPASIKVSRACGPCREPPPPKCVEIVPDDKCQIRGPGHVDPCAHKPRVIISIDRSKTRDCNVSASKSSACNQGASSGGITSRIMKSLNLNKGTGGDSCPNTANRQSGRAQKGPAQYAGDTGWCGKIQPPPAPTRCRPPTQEERLRKRACRDIPCGQQNQTKPPHTRGLHTATASSAKEPPKDMKSMATQTKENLEKLEKMLANRASYKEAAKGRVVDCAPKVDVPATGGLELPVPPGAATIRVNVSLDPAKSASCSAPMRSSPPCAPSSNPCTSRTVKETPCAARAAATTCGAPSAVSSSFTANSLKCAKKCEPSFIKTLQKKISDTCRRTEASSKDPCTNPCQPKQSPCGPPPKPSKPSPSPTPCQPKRSPCGPLPKPSRPIPCPPPKAPSKKSDCDKKKKPSCFAPVLSTQVDVCN